MPAPNFPTCRSLGYQTDLAMLALQGAQFQQLAVPGVGPMLAARTPENPAFWWGNFLLLPTLPQAEPATLLATFSAQFPAAQHRTFGLDVPLPPGELTMPASLAPWQSLGFSAEASTALTAARTEPPRPLPSGVELRPLQTDADWAALLKLRLAVNAAGADPIPEPEYRPFVAAKLAALRRAQRRGQGTYFGAFEGGELWAALGIYAAGQLGEGPFTSEPLARFQTVETHPQQRSRGLAGNLVHAAGQWAQRNLGAQRLVISADPGYFAQALYQRLGFTPAEQTWALARPPCPAAGSGGHASAG